jgi:hypothetical protein
MHALAPLPERANPLTMASTASVSQRAAPPPASAMRGTRHPTVNVARQGGPPVADSAVAKGTNGAPILDVP